MGILSDNDGGVAYSFGLDVDNVPIKHIMSIGGISMETDNIEVKQNSPEGKYLYQVVPGRKHGCSFKVTRALTGDKALADWAKDAFTGDVKKARRNGTIYIYDYNSKETIMSYNFTQGWAKDYTTSDFQAGDTSVLTESVTVVCQDLVPGA